MNVLHLDLSTAIPRARDAASYAPPRAEFHGGTEEDIRRVFGRDREAAAQRLQDLDEECSIEGLFESSAAVVGLATLGLGLAVDDRWLVLPVLISLLLLQQTLQGWCPVLPLMRGLGFRTDREIQVERHVLLQLEEEQAGSPSAVPPPPARAGASPQQLHHVNAGTACASSFSLRKFLLQTAH